MRAYWCSDGIVYRKRYSPRCKKCRRRGDRCSAACRNQRRAAAERIAYERSIKATREATAL